MIKLMANSTTDCFEGHVMQLRNEVQGMPCNPLTISKLMVVSRCYTKYYKYFFFEYFNTFTANEGRHCTKNATPAPKIAH
jgi:hypothetical protein